MPRGKRPTTNKPMDLWKANCAGFSSRPVRLCQFLGAHPQSPVGNVDQDAAGRQPAAGDDDWRVGGGQRRGVLGQLGEQVHKIADGRCAYRDARRRGERDALLVLDLRYRRPDHIRRSHGLVPLAGQLMARQDQQVLGEVTDAGCEAVQLGQTHPVGFALLKIVKEPDLAVGKELAR